MLTIGAAALLAAALLAAGVWIGKPAAAVALGAAYVAGHVGLLGWPPFPPIEATQWLVYLAAAGAAIGAIEPIVSPSSGMPRWILRSLLLAATLGLLLRPLVAHTWSRGQAAAWLAALAVVAFGFWVSLGLALERIGSVSGWLVLALVASGSALALALSGSLVLGELAGVLAAAGIAGFIVALATRGRVPVAQGLPVAATVLIGLLLAGYFYSELPAASALLLAVSPAVALAVPARGNERRRDTVFRALAVSAPIAAAIAVAYLSSPPLY